MKPWDPLLNELRKDEHKKKKGRRSLLYPLPEVSVSR